MHQRSELAVRGHSRERGVESVASRLNGRLLIEAAWYHRARYVLGRTMRGRWELASPAARARGDEGNRRLHTRSNTFRARHKRHVIANVAIAHELAGWCWSLAVLEE